MRTQLYARPTAGGLVRLLSMALLVLLLSACDDIMGVIDPCSVDGACEVEGISFVVDQLSLSAMHDADENRNYIASGTPLEVSYVVRNRGDETSMERTMTLCITPGSTGSTGCTTYSRSINLGPLDPGERQSGTVTFPLSEDINGDRSVRATINHRSHSQTTENITIEWPRFRGDLTILQGEVRAGETLPVEIRIHNDTRVKVAPSSRAGLCITPVNLRRCLEAHPMEMKEIPGLEAGGVHVDTVTYTVPAGTLEFPEDTRNRTLSLLVNANDAVNAWIPGNGWTSANFSVLPNIDIRCGITDLQVGAMDSGSLNPTGCDLRWNRGVNIYRVDVQAGQPYQMRIESSDGEAYRWSGLIMDPSAGEVASLIHWAVTLERVIPFTPSVSGSHYVVVGYGTVNRHPSGQPYRLTVVEL